MGGTPEKLPKRITSFWNHIDSVYRWSQKHKMAALSAKILDAKLRANGTKPGGAPVGEDEDKMRLAYGYKAAGRWQDALKIFDSYARQPIQMGGSGPWGRAFTVILPGREAAECRKQLGLPPVQDPREFDLGKPVLCLHAGGHASELERSLTSVGAFAAATDGLWIGLGGKLLRLDFNLKTNLVVALPIDADVPITCVCLTPSEIWIGTHGAGADWLRSREPPVRSVDRERGVADELHLVSASGRRYALDRLRRPIQRRAREVGPQNTQGDLVHTLARRKSIGWRETASGSRACDGLGSRGRYLVYCSIRSSPIPQPNRPVGSRSRVYKHRHPGCAGPMTSSSEWDTRAG